MTLHPDGRVTCNGCRGDCGNGGVTECVPFPFLDSDAELRQGHWCLREDATHRRCAALAVTAETMAASHPDGIDLYRPPPEVT